MSKKASGGKKEKVIKEEYKPECRFVRERITAYLSEEVEGTEAEEIREHLRTCRACREALNSETRLNRVMHSVLKPRVEPEYWSRTWPRIQVALVARRQRRARRVLRWVVSGAGTAAAAAALFLGFFLPWISTTPVATHDDAYFADLPSEPPTFEEVTGAQTGGEDKSVEIATLSLGNTPPSQRISHFQQLEGL